jgi:3-deoxy-D-manno-octulosonic-acid transferase
MKRIFQSVEIIEKKESIWVHCASVGEVNLAEPIIQKFLEETSNQIILTMMTDTGRATAEKKYSDNPRVKLLFFPLDDYFTIRRILNKIELKKLILIETEIWPNLIKLCAKKSSVVMINGRISDRSINSYNRIKFLLKGLFKYIDIFIMQTEQDKKRIISLGAESNRVYNYGNLKFNIELPIFDRLELEKLKKKLGIDGERVFVAGSTRDDEEEYILEAFDKLENTILILVPRHIERTDDICRRLLDGKYHYERWSKIEEGLGVIHELPKRQIIIVDKIGELRKLYAICDVAYVGGTLVNIGGHSLLEPLFYRKPPIFGPYLQNVRNIAKEVLAREIGFQVNDSEELYEILSKYDFLINNHKENEKNMIERIEQFFEENSHVVELTFEKIK